MDALGFEPRTTRYARDGASLGPPRRLPAAAAILAKFVGDVGFGPTTFSV